MLQIQTSIYKFISFTKIKLWQDFRTLPGLPLDLPELTLAGATLQSVLSLLPFQTTYAMA